MPVITANSPPAAAQALAATYASPAAVLAFKGARLGMTVDEWMALARPGPAGRPADALCEAANSGPPKATICFYGKKYGSFIARAAFDRDGGFRARRPRYEFVNDRLVRITYRTSIDAFDFVETRLKTRYGEPTKVRRDSIKMDGVNLPRVQTIWRLPAGEVRLIDPSSVPNRLLVRIEAKQ